MADLKTASQIKGDSKPKAHTDEVPKANNTSSVGEKNLTHDDWGVAGDGSVPGDEPNTYKDAGDLEATR